MSVINDPLGQSHNVPPVAIIIFTWNSCLFCEILRTETKKITKGRDYESAK